MPFRTFKIEEDVATALSIVQDLLGPERIISVDVDRSGNVIKRARIKFCYPSRDKRRAFYFARGIISITGRKARRNVPRSEVIISLMFQNIFFIILLVLVTLGLFLLDVIPKGDELGRFARYIENRLVGTSLDRWYPAGADEKSTAPPPEQDDMVLMVGNVNDPEAEGIAFQDGDPRRVDAGIPLSPGLPRYCPHCGCILGPGDMVDETHLRCPDCAMQLTIRRPLMD